MQNRILFIEDDETLQRMYRTFLQNRGYVVTSAYDGAEGLQKARKEHPDIILLDIRMPKMDGMTMLSKLRQDVWGKNAKVIILTNFDQNDEILRSVVADQPSYYLIKSNIKPETIIEYINMVLGEQKTQKQENE